MELSHGVRLRPGYVAVRRSAEALQVGLDAPARVVVPDTAEVRRLLADLEHGIAHAPADAVARRVLADLADADLIEPVARPRLAPIAVDAPDGVRTVLMPLVWSAGLRLGPDAVATLVADDRPVSRRRLDPLIRAGRPHLLVTGGAREWTVGPFVVPGVTACVRCVDAHLAQVDPRRSVVLDQLAREPRSPHAVDALTRQTALCLAVADLRTYAAGRTPGTWSATYMVGVGTPVRRDWARHPHCGCSWDVAAG